MMENILYLSGAHHSLTMEISLLDQNFQPMTQILILIHLWDMEMIEMDI